MSQEQKRRLNGKDNRDWIEVVQEHVSSVSFGVIQITVHDSRVVQVEKTEKLRFDKPESR